jgi:hemin uptake protein HemP
MMTNGQTSKTGAVAATSLAPAAQSRTAEDCSAASPLSSLVVLRGQKSITIEHQGSVYRLQVTKLGKLILTK